ncbi:ABC transporter permease [Ancylobacter sp. VNQ12]|uniref:ABC transporter permease n=1 Tax=Ancylobacter sp. VNQ12 TaxID=3400920 RepID=UPI003C0B2A3D
MALDRGESLTKPSSPTAGQTRPAWWTRTGLNEQTLGLSLVLLLLVAVFSALSPNFLSVANWTNILRQVSNLMLLACGQTLVILTGGIDLSIGAMMGLVSVFTAIALIQLDPVVAVVVGLAVGILVGLVNGLLIGKARITPFVATLGTMAITGGLAMVLTNGAPIHGIPNTWFFDLGRGFLGPVPIPVVFAVIGIAAVHVLLNYTTFGRYLYAIGGNEEATILAGVDVNRYKIGTYMLAGIFSAVAAILLTSRVITGQPRLGTGMELDSIAAVVIGGTALAGGTGSIGGTVIGVLIIGVLRNGLTLVGVSTFMQEVVIGVMLIVAIYFSSLRVARK